MDPFECYTYEEAIGNETVFARSQHQVYSRLISNLQRLVNLVYNYNIYLKRGTRQTAQIAEPPQGVKIH